MYSTATVPDPRCYLDALDQFPHPCDPDATLAHLTPVKDGGAAHLVKIERITDRLERARLVQHAQMFTALRHPNVVGVRELRMNGAMTYAVTDHFDAVRLSTVLEESRRHEGGPGLPLGIALRIVFDVLGGLAALQEAFSEETPRMIHGELQPASILVGVDGRARIDRLGGVATIDSRTTKMSDGDAPYRAPEQWIGESLDERTDLYAVGAILWELIAGRRLFSGSVESPLFTMMRGEVPAPGGSLRVAPELFALCRRALAPCRADRHRSALEFASEIRSLAHHFVIPFAREDVTAYLETRLAEDLRIRRASVRFESHRVPVSSNGAGSPVPVVHRPPRSGGAPLGNEEPTLSGMSSLAELVRSLGSTEHRGAAEFDFEAKTTAFQRPTTPVPPISATMVSGTRSEYRPEAITMAETSPMVAPAPRNSAESLLPARPPSADESSWFEAPPAPLPQADPSGEAPPSSEQHEQPVTVRRPRTARLTVLAGLAAITAVAAAVLAHDTTLASGALSLLAPRNTSPVEVASVSISPSPSAATAAAALDDTANQASRQSLAAPASEPDPTKASPLSPLTAPSARQPQVHRPRPRRAPPVTPTAPSGAPAPGPTSGATESLRSMESTEPGDPRIESEPPALRP